MNTPPRLNEIILSCIDLVYSEQWFREGLGLLPAGGTRLGTATPFANHLLDEAPGDAMCWWLVGADPTLRLTLLQFSHPLPRLREAGFRPCDLGYTRLGVHVADFDATLARLDGFGSPALGPVLGAPGARRACVCSPDGLFVELMEQDPLPGSTPAALDCRASIRSITLSTSALEESRAHFEALTGATPAALALHEDTHEALWGLPGATCARLVLPYRGILLELVHYAAPVGRGLPEDHRLSDQGVAGIGFAVEQDAYADWRARGLRAGLRVSAEAGASSTFLNDPLGFTIRFGHEDTGAASGFTPGSTGGRETPFEYKFETTTIVDASYDRVWAALNDHDRADQWIEADRFTVVKHGTPSSAGYGAVRLLEVLGRRVLQEVVCVTPGRVGYRAIAGTPFSYHNGTAVIREDEKGVHFDWTIRFRTADPALGLFVRGQLENGIPHQLERFKEMVEKELVT